MAGSLKALNFTSNFSADTVELSTFIVNAVGNFPSGHVLTEQDIVVILSNYVAANQTPILQLSTVKIDFEAIKQQFIAALTNMDSWKDIVQSGGGETVLEFISAVASLNQTGIIVNSQENSLGDAVLTPSIFVLMRSMGVHIYRPNPAGVQVSLTSSYSGVIIIPALTSLDINGIPFFNRTPIIFNPTNLTVITTLYQGDISNVQSISSTGYPFQRFEIGNNASNISDTDIYCFTDKNVTWTSITDGLYKYKANDLVFYSNTTPEGNVEVLLGNGIYGSLPALGTIMNFVYATTLGAKGNSTAPDQQVSITGFNNFTPDRIDTGNSTIDQTQQDLIKGSITGITTSIISNGDNGRDKEYYRALGPFLNSAKKGMIRKADHIAIGLAYPGMADILFQNQKDIMPYNRNLINVVYVTPLLQSGQLMTNVQWEDFVAYMTAQSIWRLDWVLFQPTRIDVSVTATLYCPTSSNITNIATYAEYNLRQEYAIDQGSLGYSLLRSDMYDVLKINYQSMIVDYSEVQTPILDVQLTNTQWINITDVSLEVQYSSRNYEGFTSPAPVVISPG
jgi:hypothetical protein